MHKIAETVAAATCYKTFLANPSHQGRFISPAATLWISNHHRLFSACLFLDLVFSVLFGSFAFVP